MSFVNTILASLFNTILLPLVASIYGLINWAFQVFLIIGYTNIFGSTSLHDISVNIYSIIGVAMMFIIAYNILLVIIDPSKDKGGAVTVKLIRDIVISLIAIIVCPVIFEYASKFQLSILENNVITKIVYGDSETNSDGSTSTIVEGGRLLSAKIWESFYQPTADFANTHCADWSSKDSTRACRAMIQTGGTSLAAVDDIAEQTGNFLEYAIFTDDIISKNIEWHWLLSIAAGVFVLYIILSYCVEMAERIVKLVLYQFLAPVCISARILPNQDKVFKNWLSALIKTYLSVFIKLFALTLSVYMINVFGSINILESVTQTVVNNNTYFLAVWAYLFMVIGVLLLMKNVTKYLEEIFGFKMAGKGLMGSLKDSGIFTAGAVLGGGVASAITNFRDKGDEEHPKSFGQRLRSSLGGFGSGAYNGIRNGKDAKDFKSMGAAINASKDNAYKNKLKRAARSQRYAADGFNAITGRWDDFKKEANDYFGGGLEGYNAIIKEGELLNSLKGDIDSAAKDLVTKHATDIHFRGDDHKVKGIEDADLQRIRKDFNGMSLAEMELSIEAAKKASDGKNISSAKLRDLALKESYYQQVLKSSYAEVVDNIESGAYVEKYGKDADGNSILSAADISPIKTGVDKYVTAFELGGKKLEERNYSSIKKATDEANVAAGEARQSSYKAQLEKESRKEGK